MAVSHGLIDRVAPDCIVRLRRAAKMRFDEAATLQGNHRLAAVYWYGYSVEMCLVAACFRNMGFAPNQEIDRDTRIGRMADARQKGIMESDPHPLVGWAELLRCQSSPGNMNPRRGRLLDQAVDLARKVYRHWRPELRYKVMDVKPECLDEVRQAAKWFVDNQSQL
jgi:hypothetical protein